MFGVCISNLAREELGIDDGEECDAASFKDAVVVCVLSPYFKTAGGITGLRNTF